MEAQARTALLRAPLLLTVAQALLTAFLASSVNFGTEAGDLWRRFACIGLSFVLSVVAGFARRDRLCSAQSAFMLTFASCAAFGSVFSLAPGQACVVQSSRFILFFKVRLHLGVLLNLASCAVLAGYITVVRYAADADTVYADTHGVFAHLGNSAGAVLREARLALALGSAAALGLSLAGVALLMPLLNALYFVLRIELFYNSTLELLIHLVFTGISNWAYTVVTGMLAEALVYNCSVMPYEDEGALAGLRAGRLALHRFSTAPAHAPQMPARQLSEYAEAELGRANSILGAIEAAAVRHENSAFVSVPQANRGCSAKIRSYDACSYAAALWAYQVAVLVLPLRYHAVSAALRRILAYFLMPQGQAVRQEAALQRIPAMLERLLARERQLEKRCGVELESRRLAGLLAQLAGP